MLGSWLDFMMLRVSSNQNNSVIPWFYEICFTDNSWGTSGEGRPGFVLFPSDIRECCSASWLPVPLGFLPSVCPHSCGHAAFLLRRAAAGRTWARFLAWGTPSERQLCPVTPLVCFIPACLEDLNSMRLHRYDECAIAGQASSMGFSRCWSTMMSSECQSCIMVVYTVYILNGCVYDTFSQERFGGLKQYPVTYLNYKSISVGALTASSEIQQKLLMLRIAHKWSTSFFISDLIE